MNKSSFALILAFLVLCGAGAYWYQSSRNSDADILSFEDCAKKYPVQESYPARCTTDSGKTFSQNIGNELEKVDLITIDSPRPTATVTSPLTVSGKARGYWYFEASFPVELKDAGGNTLVITPAQAQSDWMTEDFVPYAVTLTFPPQPAGSTGTLILRRDNPSGLPENDDQLIVPVMF